MTEHRNIIDRWRRGSATILATLVRVEGSSYRQPGARLMISSDGTYEGGISAGCLEGELLRKATWLIRHGSAVERYSTLFDEATEMPFGLGCGGVLDVLLEPVAGAECQALLRAMEATLAGCGHRIATWLPAGPQQLMRAIFDNDGAVVFASEGLPDEWLAAAKIDLHGEQRLPGVFLERLQTPQRLFVFGAGDDAKPLVTMACLLGWNVTVVDGRTHLARAERFPGVGVRVTSAADAALSQVQAEDAVVLMTHSYEQDREYLSALLPMRPRYLGLLGSRQRSALLIADAAAKLDWSIGECCERICAPIGLDIGGEGPEDIALAILAEAQASCAGRLGHSRKLSVDHVEHHVAHGTAQAYLSAQCGLGAA